ncbi:MAG: hypothetical protein L3J43_05160 [Sulfurovum sp.]|nr:hypothetical protein [Sulfurovum sp.]
MKMITIRTSRRVYIIFSIIFGWIPIGIILLSYSKGTIVRDLPMIVITLSVLLLVYTLLSIYKITYDENQINYRGLFGIKTINIMDIKRYKIKSTVDATKPTVGLYLDTVNKKSEIVIPANLFTSQSLNDLMNHINTINGSAKGKANAGKSVFSYRKKKKV